MSEKFIELFEEMSKIDYTPENELWNHLNKCVNKTYKFTNNECITFYITVVYFRGFDRIGIHHINDQGESVTDE